MAEITKEMFPDWLYTKLKEKKIKQLKFAETLGVNRATISKWVGGTQYPHPATMKRIMNVLGEDKDDTDEPAHIDNRCIPDQHPEEILDMYKTLSPEDQFLIRNIITHTFIIRNRKTN